METQTVLLTTTYYPPYHTGGDAVYVRYLARGLARLGHEVSILHSVDAYKVAKGAHVPEGGVLEEDRALGIDITSIRSPFGKLSPYSAFILGRSAWNRKQFDRTVERTEPDLVHHNNIYFLGADLLDAPGKYRRYHTIHDYWAVCPKRELTRGWKNVCQEPGRGCAVCLMRSGMPPQLWRRGRRLKDAFLGLDGMIAPSNYARDVVGDWTGRKKSIRTIHNFSPENPYAGRVEKRDHVSFLFVGRIARKKGINELLDAMSELKREGSERRLVVVGSGPLKTQVRSRVQNGLEGTVDCREWVDDDELARLFARSSAVVIPSFWPDNNPIVVAEALAAGTPPITSNWGGLPEVPRKIDRSLVFDDDGLVRTLRDFEPGGYDPSRLVRFHRENLSIDAYLKQYLKVIRG